MGYEIASVTWESVAVGVSGEVVTSVQAGGFTTLYDARGIAWDGVNLWLAGSYSGISKVDTSGKILGNYSAPALHLRGLTIDGLTFWAFDGETGRIYHFSVDESGAVPQTRIIGSFEAPMNGVNGGIDRGIAWDGTNLWYSDRYNVYRLDTSGKILSNFEFPYEVPALAWDGEHLWLAFNRNYSATLVKVDSEGHSLFVVNFAVDSVYDLAWVDGYMWAVGSTKPYDGITSPGSEMTMVYNIQWRTMVIGMQN
jgi:hypothetical protein